MTPVTALLAVVCGAGAAAVVAASNAVAARRGRATATMLEVLGKMQRDLDRASQAVAAQRLAIADLHAFNAATLARSDALVVLLRSREEWVHGRFGDGSPHVGCPWCEAAWPDEYATINGGRRVLTVEELAKFVGGK